MIWDSAFVINLGSRPDRWEQFQLNDVVAERVPGQLPQTRDGWHSSPQALGCALAHRDALTRARGTALILEDDVVIGPGFADQVESIVMALPDDWKLLKLGGEHLKPPEPVSPGIVRCVLTARTHAYLVRDSAMAKVLIDIIDTATSHWDAPYGVVPAYAPDPFIVRVSGSPSDIPDSRA